MHLEHSIKKTVRRSQYPMAKKRLDQRREALHLKHYTYRPQEAYVDWVRRFVL